jgi:tetratricopeptide (TPR) repeat protein
VVVWSLAAQSGELERARQLLASGHAAEAAAIYRELAHAQPPSADLLLNLAIAEYKAGAFREAADAASAALKLNPALGPAQLFLGASYLELGDAERAVAALERVVAANPRERNGRLMLGEALLATGRPADAVLHLAAASELLPDNPRVWYELGRAYEALGRKQNAQHSWERLTTLPPSRESHLHAAEMHDSAERWREAAAEWRQALQLAPQDRRLRVGLAWALYRSRDYDAAMAILKPLLTGEAAEVEFLYAASLLNLQQPLEAIPYLRSATAHNPRLLPARAALGQALLQTGKPGEAVPLLESARSTDRDGTIHYQLYRAYRELGRDADARRALQEYQRIREPGASPTAPR